MNKNNSRFHELSNNGYTSTGYSFNSKINAEKEARKFRRVGYYARVIKSISNGIYAMYGEYFLMIKRNTVNKSV